MFARDAVRLTARIAIPAAYPLLPPTAQLAFSGPATDGADHNLRAMEAEINVHTGDLLATAPSATSLLPMQLRRLLMCFDVYMEVEEDLAKSSAARSAGGFGKLFVRGIR